jgi:hypothetical protein
MNDLSTKYFLNKVVAEKGVIVGCDREQEWLLPWWWGHFSRFNALDVAFADFGMSKEGRAWCEDRGVLIDLSRLEHFVRQKAELDPSVVGDMEKKLGSWIWPCRNSWFKKPFACLKTPFHKSIWIDLDCEVRGSLASLLETEGFPLSMTQYADARFAFPLYNTGVILFQRGEWLLEEWAELAVEKNEAFFGDQDALSWLIHEKQKPVALLAPIYNWSRALSPQGPVVVLHWHGPQGKSIILDQIMRSNLQSLDLLD